MRPADPLEALIQAHLVALEARVRADLIASGPPPHLPVGWLTYTLQAVLEQERAALEAQWDGLCAALDG